MCRGGGGCRIPAHVCAYARDLIYETFMSVCMSLRVRDHARVCAYARDLIRHECVTARAIICVFGCHCHCVFHYALYDYVCCSSSSNNIQDQCLIITEFMVCEKKGVWLEIQYLTLALLKRKEKGLPVA